MAEATDTRPEWLKVAGGQHKKLVEQQGAIQATSNAAKSRLSSSGTVRTQPEIPIVMDQDLRSRLNNQQRKDHQARLSNVMERTGGK
jgi:hypothetical protein